MAPPKKYKLTKTSVMDQWGSRFTCVKTWLSKQNGTKAARALALWYFCEWAATTPDELLQLKSSYGCLDAERLLDRFVAEADFPDSVRYKSSIAVRSFFRCNYRRLESEAGKIEYVVKKERRIPTKEQRLRLYEACLNPRDRAIFCVDVCSGMALETLSKLKWHHFEEDWQSQETPYIHLPSSIIKGHGRGKYKGVMQETFITPEAKQVLKRYREWMTKKYGVEWSDDMNVFLCIDFQHEPLSYQSIASVFVDISKIAGVAFSSHDGRRILQTALENAGVMENFIRKIKGRKVRGEDNPYSRPYVDMLRRKYSLVVPDLEFIRQPAKQANKLSKDALDLFGKLNDVLETYPDKMEKFEKFILNL